MKKFYAFVSKSEDFDGEYHQVIMADNLPEAMRIFGKRYFGEPYYKVDCFEIEFDNNGIADLYYIDE